MTGLDSQRLYCDALCHVDQSVFGTEIDAAEIPYVVWLNEHHGNLPAARELFAAAEVEG